MEGSTMIQELEVELWKVLISFRNVKTSVSGYPWIPSRVCANLTILLSPKNTFSLFEYLLILRFTYI